MLMEYDNPFSHLGMFTKSNQDENFINKSVSVDEYFFFALGNSNAALLVLNHNFRAHPKIMTTEPKTFDSSSPILNI